MKNLIVIAEPEGQDPFLVSLTQTARKPAGYTAYSTWEATNASTNEVLGTVSWYEDHMGRHLSAGNPVMSISCLDGTEMSLRGLPDGASLHGVSKDAALASLVSIMNGRRCQGNVEALAEKAGL